MSKETWYIRVISTSTCCDEITTTNSSSPVWRLWNNEETQIYYKLWFTDTVGVWFYSLRQKSQIHWKSSEKEENKNRTSVTWLPHRLRTTRLESRASWGGRTFRLLRDKFSFSNSTSSHSSSGTPCATAGQTEGGQYSPRFWILIDCSNHTDTRGCSPHGAVPSVLGGPDSGHCIQTVWRWIVWSCPLMSDCRPSPRSSSPPSSLPYTLLPPSASPHQTLRWDSTLQKKIYENEITCLDTTLPSRCCPTVQVLLNHPGEFLLSGCCPIVQ